MRSWLALTLMAATFASSGPAAASNERQPTYILVHGAFHGGWVWKRVAEKLRAGNARVYTPTLAGLGDRAHEARPAISLGTHVQDILALIEFEDLHDVILVGHSYGGMVITGVAAARPERIRQLVYFDAVIPENGQSFFDAIEFSQPLPPDMWKMPSFPPEDFGLTDPADISFVGPRLSAQPLATFEEPLGFSWATLANIPKLYIHCTGEWFSREVFLQFRAKALERGWSYHELQASHEAMLTAVEATHTALRRAEN